MNLENPLYFWRMLRKQKMMRDAKWDTLIYKKKMMEKYKLIRSKSQIVRSVPEEKPEQSSPEIDLVDGQANYGEAKMICDTVHKELLKGKPTSKFEGADFASMFS